MVTVHDDSGIEKKLACFFSLSFVTVFCGCASVDRAMGDVDRICVDSSTVELLGETEWVVIGNLLGGLGSFDTEEIDDAFAAYSNCANERGSLQTVDEFEQAIAGWTLIEVRRFDVPLLFSFHGNLAVLVPHDLLDREDFDVGLPGIWMGYGNLVSARWTPDHVFVVTEVLCEKDDDYRECSSKYERGLFNLTTGLEHSRDGEPKRSSTQIDSTTYKRIE